MATRRLLILYPVLKSDLSQHEDNTEGAVNSSQRDSEKVLWLKIVTKMSNISGLVYLGLYVAANRQTNATIASTHP